MGRYLIKYPRFAEVYFDRKRGIVYTWHEGKVAACRFENLGFKEERLGLMLYLQCENKKRKEGYWPLDFAIQPTNNAYYNTQKDNTVLMAQIFAFMDVGKALSLLATALNARNPLAICILMKSLTTLKSD